MSEDHVDACVANCGRPSEGYYLCRWCADELAHQLSTVADLSRELSVATCRWTRLGDPVPVSGQGPAPLPFDPTASEAREVLRNTLSTWVRDLSERTGHSCEAVSNGALALWIRARLTVVRTHPAADELVDEIAHAIRFCWSVVDRPRERAYVGVCGSETEDGPCECDLYAAADASRIASRVIRCPACGTQHDAEARREWLFEQLRGTLATAREIASAAVVIAGRSINAKTIRSWAERGVITSYPAHPAGGPARHEIGEVIDRAMHATTRAHAS